MPTTSLLVPAGRRVTAVAAAVLTQLAAIVASTSVVAAAPRIAVSLNSLQLVAWIFSANAVASAVAMLVAGELSDRAGRRRLLLGGLAVFLVGSLASAASQSMPELIAARVVSGVGAGAMVALSQALIGDVFPPRQRSQWLGAQMTLYGVFNALGPVLGGVAADHFGWPVVFLIAVPPGLLALAFALHSVPKVARSGRLHLDWVAIVALSVTAGGGLVLLTPSVLGSRALGLGAVILAVIVFALALLVVNERRTPHPVFVAAVLSSGIFRALLALSVLGMIVFAASLNLVPIAILLVDRGGVQSAGTILLPFMVCHAVGGLLSGTLIPRLPHISGLLVAGALLNLAALLLLAAGAHGGSRGLLGAGLAGAGMGTGIILPTTAILVQTVFPHRLLGSANSTRLFSGTVGAFLAVPALTSVAFLPLGVAGGAQAVATASGRSALAFGLTLALAISALCALAMVPIALRIPPVRLRDSHDLSAAGEPVSTLIGVP